MLQQRVNRLRNLELGDHTAIIHRFRFEYLPIMGVLLVPKNWPEAFTGRATWHMFKVQGSMMEILPPCQKLACGLGVLLVAVICAPIVKGDTITTYTYTGNVYTEATGAFTLSEDVSGFFTESTPLAANLSETLISAPTTFSFSDGPDTFTQSSNLSAEHFFIGTDENGNIDSWEIVLQTGSPADELTTSQNGDEVCEFDCGTFADNDDNPGGSWTTTSISTPEPASILLMPAGLLALALLARNRKVLLTACRR